jgi:transposase
MADPYLNDLSKKVIGLVESGKQQKEAEALLGIDKSTVLRWYKRFKKTGSVQPKDYHNNRGKIKIDPLKIEEIIQK